MQQPDNRGEIIWMLDRMMSLCICVPATENKHETLLTGVKGQEKLRNQHIYSCHTGY